MEHARAIDRGVQTTEFGDDIVHRLLHLSGVRDVDLPDPSAFGLPDVELGHDLPLSDSRPTSARPNPDAAPVTRQRGDEVDVMRSIITID